MTVAEDIQDTVVERKPWVPRVLRGGKGPPEAPSDDWLKDLAVGTVFVAKPNDSVVEYNSYCIVFIDLPVMLLNWRLPDGKILDYYVDTEGFSKKNKAYKVLGHVPFANEEEEKEKQIGNSNRSD